MKTIHSLLSTMDITNKRIFLRADLNVPLVDGDIIEDYRMKQLQPTLDYLLQQNASILLVTHLGRPKEKEKELSTQHLIQWFKKRDYPIHHTESLSQAALMMRKHPQTIVLLENIRFFPGEQDHNKQLAHDLKDMTDIYVTDAFGALHRSDVSVADLPLLYTPGSRTIGFLIEKELEALNKVMVRPQKPFLLMLGGGKVHDKIKLFEALLTALDKVLICPALVFTFMKALGNEVGTSLVDTDHLDSMCALMKKAIEHHVELVVPTDILAEEDNSLKIVPLDAMTPQSFGLSVGPDTVETWRELIMSAGTIVVNGLAGMQSKPDSLKYYKEILKLISKSTTYSVITGGDAGSAALSLGKDYPFDYISTGGGSSLAYLSGQELPGLKPFIKKEPA